MVAEGPPEEIARKADVSHTGRFLAEVLGTDAAPVATAGDEARPTA